MVDGRLNRFITMRLDTFMVCALVIMSFVVRGQIFSKEQQRAIAANYHAVLLSPPLPLSLSFSLGERGWGGGVSQ